MRLSEYVSECPTYTRKNSEPHDRVDPVVYPLAKKPAGRLRVDLRKLNRIAREVGDQPGSENQEVFNTVSMKRMDIIHELNRRVRMNGNIY